MRCLTREQIAKHADSELSREERRTVEAHLAACPECRSLHERTKGFDAVLRACGQASSPPGAGACPDGETIAALMDGSLTEGEGRARVAAHVAGCGACAVRAADAAETAQLVDRLEAHGLARPPLGLVEKVRDRLFRKGPFPLGQIAVSIRELIERFRAWAEAASPGPVSSIAESSAPYAPEPDMLTRPASNKVGGRKTSRWRKKPARKQAGRDRRKPGRAGAKEKKKPAGESGGEKGITRAFTSGDLAIDVALSGTPAGTVECAVVVRDRGGRPLAAVPVELRQGPATLGVEPTGPDGSAVFRNIGTGSYQVIFRHGGLHRIDLALS